MEHFEHEARRLLGEAVAKLNPYPTRELRAEAADLLLKNFVAIALAQGLDAGQVPDAKAYYVSARSGSLSVRLITDGETFNLQRFQFQYLGKPRRASLAFDCVTNTFWGTDIDADVAPIPGTRLPYVHPLIVLARLTAELLTTTDA